MTLEDFFTLTEMKNGLATLARVEELISRMQQQKDCVLTNVGDTARQWSTVASTLAATESRDCLNHFVNLNGLSFLNCWLQEALKCSNDFADNAVEELLDALLGSLEKLPIDREQSIASGVHMTIEQILGFKGLNKERAISLSERWNHAEEKVVIYEVKESGGGVCGDDKPKCSADVEAVDSATSKCLDFDNITCRERIEEGNSKMESVMTETHNSSVKVCHDASRLGNTHDILHSVADRTLPSTSSTIADANPNLGGANMSLVSNSCQEHISRIDESSGYPADSSDAIGSHVDDKTSADASMLKDDGTAKEMKVEVKQQGRSSSSCKSGQRESSKVLTSSSFSAASPANKPERSISCNFEENKYTASEVMERLPRSASVGHVPPNHLRTKEFKSAVQELYSDAKLKSVDNLETSFHSKEVAGSDSESEDLASTSDLIVRRIDSLNAHDSSKIGNIDQRSELGLEDGELDALEVAMQVAIEVEREVVDYREPFCSPSPEDSSGDVKLAQSSLVMEKYKQDQPVKEEVNVNVAFPGKTLASSSSSPKDDNLNNSETDVEPDTCHDGQLMQIEDAYESIVKSDRDRCDFDLNEDIGNEEYDCLVNPLSSNSVSIPAPSVSVSTPIAVAASKGAPLLPIAPLCFEGELGWKGSAATSAFRPASPRKTDAEKRSAGQKRKSNFMEIDLNVAENGDDDVVVGPVAIKATPVSSGFRSQDDSMEVSSRRADRLKLDLNRLGDDDMSPDQLLYRRLPHRSSEQTLSSASSSSSRQPLMRDFDLNDNPGFFDAIGSYNVKNSSAKTTGMYDSSKFDVSAITIMGSRMAVERKDFLGDTRQSLMGTGQSIEPSTIMASRPMLPYNHIPLSTYGYNAQVMGPPVPFTPSVYGPGNSPYMVDSRGTTAVPQIAGGAGVHGAPSATPSFLMSVPNAPLTLNFMGSSQSFFDLNSAMSTMEAANRDAGSLKHAFMQGHNGLWEKR